MTTTAPRPASIADLFSLANKTAIVTGGRGGLGLSTTLALAEAGANIISIQLPSDPSADSLAIGIRGLNRSFAAYECDIASSPALRSTFQRTWADGTVPDILLNSAGAQRRGRAEELGDEAIDAVLDVDLKATFAACQEVGKRLSGLGRKGKIINTAGIISFTANTDIAPYAASRGGVLQATKASRNE